MKKDAYYPLFDRMVYKPNQEVYTLPRSNFIKRISHELEDVSDKLQKAYAGSDRNPITLFGHSNPQAPPTKTNPRNHHQTNILMAGAWKLIYVYKEEEKTMESKVRTETMGIDFGYDNLAFCAVTNNEHLLIDGRRLKSMNQHYHKQIARLASLRPNQKVLTKQMLRLMDKRNRQMEYGIFKAARADSFIMPYKTMSV
ncbi:MAG: transposase [Anaerotruncus sp.]|nr:transposase [Anaerotruncus sp.]